MLSYREEFQLLTATTCHWSPSASVFGVYQLESALFGLVRESRFHRIKCSFETVKFHA
jgi:hypothetical protein